MENVRKRNILVVEWWNKFYMPAGHKRLGRIILQFREEPELEPDEKIKQNVAKTVVP